MFDICCIGHITHDKVVTPVRELHMAGGTSFYFSHAIRNMPVSYHLVTSLAQADSKYLTSLAEAGTDMTVFPSNHTVYFENRYPADQDQREQRVIQKADPFHPDQLLPISSRIFHLGPLLADDIPATVIKSLSLQSLISLDVQGYLREVKDTQVREIDWGEKKEVLPFVDILKANETEMKVLTGQENMHEGARIISEWGVNEVIITRGSKGSLVFNDGNYYSIPAFRPNAMADATGCGDTYMAGYLYKRLENIPIQQAGEFAAAMATLKLENAGPFTGKEEDILTLLASADKRIPAAL